MPEKIKENEYIFKTEEIERGCKFFVENSSGELVGSVTLTESSDKNYNVGGLFVDPAERGRGVSTDLIKMVNRFLDDSGKTGRLINTIRGDAASVYENNGWKKGDYKADGAYGGYEYTYN